MTSRRLLILNFFADNHIPCSWHILNIKILPLINLDVKIISEYSNCAKTTSVDVDLYELVYY